MSAPADRPRVVVVGAGITGLAAAHRLVEGARGESAPVSVVVLEASGRIGGQVRTEHDGPFVFEAGPDTILTQKPWGIALCERLGLGSDLEDPGARGGGAMIFRRGRLVRVPDGFLLMAPTRVGPLLASPLFSWRGKARMLREPFVPPRPADRDDESLASFVTRRFGRETLERVAEPVIAALYTADAARLSLRMTMPRFLDLELREGSVTPALRRARHLASARPFGHGTSRGSFVSPRSGLGAIVEAIAARLTGCEIRLHARVARISRSSGGETFDVSLEGGGSIPAAAVLLACPAYEAARILRETSGIAADLDALSYASCATVSLVYPRGALAKPLSTFGFFVPRTEGLPLLACSYVSEKFPGRAPADTVVLRAFLGGATSPASLDGDDADLIARSHATLRSILSITGEPLLARVFRFPRAMPQFEVGDAARVERIAAGAASIPGLYLGGGSVGAVGLPDCIHSGETAAERISAYLAARNWGHSAFSFNSHASP